MLDTESAAPEGHASRRQKLPWLLATISILIAVLVSSALIFLLYSRTTGPGEALHDFYGAVNAGDCGAVQSFLTDDAGEVSCELQESYAGQTPDDFEVVEVVLRGESRTALVTVSEKGPGAADDPITWPMTHVGRDWKVSGPPMGTSGVLLALPGGQG